MIAFAVAFSLSLLLKYKTDESNVDAFTNARDFTGSYERSVKALADAHYPCWHLAPVTGLRTIQMAFAGLEAAIICFISGSTGL